MSGFSAAWLAMREPYDRAARNGAVLGAVAAAFAGADAVAVSDLGCGTGSTMRAMAPLLPPRQSWRLVDNDAVLLAAAARDAPAGAAVTTAALDLEADLDAAIGNCDLVATSALLDLVSAGWLARLSATLARRARPFYAALSFDGAVALEPPSPHDAAVIAALIRHQHTDKGFGPALGPDAARAALLQFRAAGFTVAEGRSDWLFAAADTAIQAEVLAGFAAAAQAVGTNAHIAAAWLAERLDHVARGRATMRVGHVDFFAAPPRQA